MAQQNPKDFILTTDFATTKQLLYDDGEPIIFSGTLNLAASATSAYVDFTIPDKQLITRCILKPSISTKWFVGGYLTLYASDYSWSTTAYLYRPSSTVLRLQWTAPGTQTALSVQYKIYLFLSPFETS